METHFIEEEVWKNLFFCYCVFLNLILKTLTLRLFSRQSFLLWKKDFTRRKKWNMNGFWIGCWIWIKSLMNTSYLIVNKMFCPMFVQCMIPLETSGCVWYTMTMGGYTQPKRCLCWNSQGDANGQVTKSLIFDKLLICHSFLILLSIICQRFLSCSFHNPFSENYVL